MAEKARSAIQAKHRCVGNVEINKKGMYGKVI
jgi:hypothetical protein